MAVGNNSQTVGKNLGAFVGRFADLSSVPLTPPAENNDFVIIEDITGYLTDPNFIIDPELVADLDESASDFTAKWDAAQGVWVIVDQDTGGGGAANLECVELSIISTSSTLQLFNAYYDTDAAEWVGSNGTSEVTIPSSDVSGYQSCECSSGGSAAGFIPSIAEGGYFEYFEQQSGVSFTQFLNDRADRNETIANPYNRPATLTVIGSAYVFSGYRYGPSVIEASINSTVNGIELSTSPHTASRVSGGEILQPTIVATLPPLGSIGVTHKLVGNVAADATPTDPHRAIHAYQYFIHPHIAEGV